MEAGQARTLSPVSPPHNVQGAGGAGGQGPHASTIWEPLHASEAWLEKLDSVLGTVRLYSYLREKRDSPCREPGGPSGEENRALHCARERGSPLAHSSGPGAEVLHESLSRTGQASERWTRKSLARETGLIT